MSRLFYDEIFLLLKGELHPDQKIACFALYFKIVNTFVQTNVYILKHKLKNGNGILVGQVVFK